MTLNLLSALACAAAAYRYCASAGGNPGAAGAWAAGAGLLGLLTTRLLIVATKLLALGVVLGTVGGVFYGGYLLLAKG